MLTTVEFVRSIPGLSNLAAVPIAFLNVLIGAADQAIKTYLKRDVELTSYVEYYSGTSQCDIILRQWPVLSARTVTAPASEGVVLPATTIYANTTALFPPGTGGNPNATPPCISVQTGISTWTAVTYTGVTPNPASPSAPPSFTGCSGGTGTLSSVTGRNGIGTPVVFLDQGGYFGQSPNAFSTGPERPGQTTQLIQGFQWVCSLDSGGTRSNRGLLHRIGGAGAGFVGFYPENFYSGKLGAYRMPVWPRGDGNIKVCYSAGYDPGKIPFDLQYAAAMMVSYMARTLPSGAPLSSESLGGYSYSVLSASADVPELGSLPRLLAPYREVSW